MKDILTSLLKSFQKTHKKNIKESFISYLNTFLNKKDVNTYTNINLIDYILKLSHSMKIDINESTLENFDINELKLIYTLMKYKSITRERPKTEYEYLFKTRNKNFLEDKITQNSTPVLNKFSSVLMANLKKIKNFIEEKNKTQKEFKIWLIKVINGLEKYLFASFEGKEIQFQILYKINFILEILHEIISRGSINFNINSFKKILNLEETEVTKLLKIFDLQTILCDNLNVNFNKFVIKGEKANEGFFLFEKINTENIQKDLFNEIIVKEEMVPFFIKKRDLEKIISISKNSRILGSIEKSEKEVCLENELLIKKLKIEPSNLFCINKKIKINSDILCKLDESLKSQIDKFLIANFTKYLSFISCIFTNKRNDFLNVFVNKLSEYENVENNQSLYKRSLAFVLADSIKESLFYSNKHKFFQDKLCEYEKDLDILFSQEEKEKSLQVILKPKYPFNLFLDERCCQILANILNVLVKLKRAELMVQSIKKRSSRKTRENMQSQLEKCVFVHKILCCINEIYLKFDLEFGDCFNFENNSQSNNKEKEDIKELINGNIKKSDECHFDFYKKLKNAFRKINTDKIQKFSTGIEIFCTTGNKSHFLFACKDFEGLRYNFYSLFAENAD